MYGGNWPQLVMHGPKTYDRQRAKLCRQKPWFVHKASIAQLPPQLIKRPLKLP